MDIYSKLSGGMDTMQPAPKNIHYFDDLAEASCKSYCTLIKSGFFCRPTHSPSSDEVCPVLDDGPGELLLRLRELDVIEERLPENELQLLTVNGALTLEKK